MSLLSTVAPINSTVRDERLEPIYSAVHSGIVRLGTTLSPGNNARDLVDTLGGLHFAVRRHMQRTSAVTLARVLHTLGITGAQHVVSDTSLSVRRFATIFVRQNRYDHFLQRVGHVTPLRGRTPSGYGSLQGENICEIRRL